MKKSPFVLAVPCLLGCLPQLGCSTHIDKPIINEPIVSVASEPSRSHETERQLQEKIRLCLDEKRRLEFALREQQKRAEENQRRADQTQKKLDALLDIDRDLRSRSKSRP